MSQNSAESTPESTPAVEPDTTSDPSLDDSVGGDWSDEGGSTPDGPATETEDA